MKGTVEVEFPEKFEIRMKNILGDEFDDFRRCILEGDNVRSLRVNTKKISVDDFLAVSPYSMEKIPYNDDGFYLKDEVRMGGEVCHQAGMFYMQEPSAMIPVNSVDIKPDWKVMDVCAAPGGKTCQLSNRLSDKGLVISNDIKFERCKALKENTERLGLTNVMLFSDEVASLSGEFDSYFDMILVDATCSGEGMFRKNANIMNYWSEKKVKLCSDIQNGLLDTVAHAVKGGGMLVYSTCTYSVEENEEIVSSFLDAHNEFSLIPLSERVRPYLAPGIMINDRYDFSLTGRFYPHKHPGEGQYVAVMRKKEDGVLPSVNEAKDKTRDYDREDVLRFLESVGISISPERIFVKGNSVWIRPETVLSMKKHVISHGVFVGELKDGIVTPAHPFFMAFGCDMTNRIEFDIDDDRLVKYLRGENIRYPAREGYGVITVSGCVIGGFLAGRGYLKNLYPANLTNKDIFEKDD